MLANSRPKGVTAFAATVAVMTSSIRPCHPGIFDHDPLLEDLASAAEILGEPLQPFTIRLPGAHVGAVHVLDFIEQHPGVRAQLTGNLEFEGEPIEPQGRVTPDDVRNPRRRGSPHRKRMAVRRYPHT